MPQTTLERAFFALILVSYLLLGILFALRLPAWQAPDEPAHYNVMAQMAAGNLLPKIEMGDWDNDYLEALKAEDFAPELLDNLSSVQYENHQPPLYYWLGTPFFLVSNGNLFVIRLYSLVLGSVTVTISYLISKEIFPNQPQIALGTMALVAFLPQNLHILSSVNNDALAGLVIADMLLSSIRYLKGKNTEARHLGFLLGIAFITKTTVYFMAAVLLLVIVLRNWDDKSKLGRELFSFSIPASIFALLYWGRNLFVYGFPDFLGLKAHDSVVVGQLRTGDYIAQIGLNNYWQEAFSTSFNSFWGQFGWMEARLADAIPFAMPYIGLLLLFGLLGLLLYRLRPNLSEESAVPQIWPVFALVIALTLGMFIYYNLSFVQFQGRYLFTAIIPLAFFLVYGLDAWRQLFKLEKANSYLTVLPFLAFALLDFYLIWRVIPCAVGCLSS
jgi:4-amino-4-deoxy-L-arabinose transferase-like glycosyltransferase